MTSPRSTMPAFDTHKAVKALCGAGFNDAQAEAVVEQINGAINENLASKEDLDRTEQNLAVTIASLATKEELRAAIAPLATKEELTRFATMEDLAQLELRVTVKMEQLTGKLLRYMGGGMALVVALIKGLDMLTR